MMKRVLAVILTIALVAVLFGCSKPVEEVSETSTEPAVTESTTAPAYQGNPLTGEAEFNQKAIGKRPVAIVVENLSPARPQWAIGTSDIIVEGEVEGGISRMLWLYADYTKVPDKVGPIRSARPSYVMFSRLYDSIFVHWGGSHTNGKYIGGYTFIKKYKVDHIDGMSGGKLFGRDTTRSTSSEHRGIIYGNKLPDVIKEKKIRTKQKDVGYAKFNFADTLTDAGATEALKVNCTFSSRTDTRAFKFSDKDKLYHTNDWKTDVAFQNVIILLDSTTYITVPYKGSSTTYLNYNSLVNGKGKGKGFYASNGKIAVIKWRIKNKKLTLTDEQGNELAINKGKSYIGLASSNNGGSVTF